MEAKIVMAESQLFIEEIAIETAALQHDQD
jgi:hypothetical protein